MDWGTAPQWLAAGGSLLAFVFSTYAAWRSANRKREREVDLAIQELGNRTSRVEGAIAHLPTQEQWVAMHASIARTEEAIKGVGRSLDRVGLLVDQLVTNELHEGREAKKRTGT